MKDKSVERILAWNKRTHLLNQNLIRRINENSDVVDTVNTLIDLIGHECFLDQELFTKIYNYAEPPDCDDLIQTTYADVISTLLKYNFLTKESLCLALELIPIDSRGDKYEFDIMIAALDLLNKRSMLSIDIVKGLWCFIGTKKPHRRIEAKYAFNGGYSIKKVLKDANTLVSNYINACQILQEANILKNATFNFLSKLSTEHLQVVPILIELDKVNILTEENLNTLSKYYAADFQSSMNIMSEILKAAPSLLDQRCFNLIFDPERTNLGRGRYLRSWSDAISHLASRNRLNTLELMKILGAKDPFKQIQVFDYLDSIGFLTEQNMQMIKRLENANNLLSVFRLLKIIEHAQVQMTQNQLNEVFLFSHLIMSNNISMLLNTGRCEPIYFQMEHIPAHLFNLEALLQICRNNHPDEERTLHALTRYLGPLLGYQMQGQMPTTPVNPLNSAQSTHTASVHVSVSESATRLQAFYKNNLEKQGMNSVLGEIKTYVSGLPGDLAELTHENSAAKRLIAKLSPDEMFWQFQDPKSAVTNIELLALVWLAIHDEKKLLCPISAAKDRFIRSLYEIQRGYNLNEDGDIDDGKPDVRICLPGSFNKLVEGLNTIHPDVEIKYITKPGATLKLQKSGIVMEEILKYLNIQNLSLGDLKKLKLKDWDLLGQEIQTVWEEVKGIIEHLMVDYQPAFKDEKQFKEFIDTGLYCIDTDRLILIIDSQIELIGKEALADMHAISKLDGEKEVEQEQKNSEDKISPVHSLIQDPEDQSNMKEILELNAPKLNVDGNANKTVELCKEMGDSLAGEYDEEQQTCVSPKMGVELNNHGKSKLLEEEAFVLLEAMQPSLKVSQEIKSKDAALVQTMQETQNIPEIAFAAYPDGIGNPDSELSDDETVELWQPLDDEDEHDGELKDAAEKLKENDEDFLEIPDAFEQVVSPPAEKETIELRENKEETKDYSVSVDILFSANEKINLYQSSGKEDNDVFPLEVLPPEVKFEEKSEYSPKNPDPFEEAIIALPERSLLRYEVKRLKQEIIALENNEIYEKIGKNIKILMEFLHQPKQIFKAQLNAISLFQNESSALLPKDSAWEIVGKIILVLAITAAVTLLVTSLCFGIGACIPAFVGLVGAAASAAPVGIVAGSMATGYVAGTVTAFSLFKPSPLEEQIDLVAEAAYKNLAFKAC